MRFVDKVNYILAIIVNLLITIFIRIPLVAFVYVLIIDKINVTSKTGSIIMYLVLFIVVVVTFFVYHPIRRKDEMDTFDYVSPRPKLQNEADKIELFSIPDIGSEYDVLGMIESSDRDKWEARVKLQHRALKLGANAVLNVRTYVDNNVSGSVGSVVGMPRVYQGKSSTVTTYHYEGTAIRIK